MAKAKIEQFYESPGVTTDRFGKTDVTVKYSIDGKGLYEVKLPKENFTPQAAEEAVKTAVRQRLAVEGKEFTV